MTHTEMLIHQNTDIEWRESIFLRLFHFVGKISILRRLLVVELIILRLARHLESELFKKLED